jgi:acetyl esterase/lipase
MAAEPAILPALALWPDQQDTTNLPRLTPYLPDSAPPTGAVIVCPGGGYARHAPHEADPIARWLTGLGLAAFVLEYRVAPHRHPLPLHDAQRAIRLVRSSAADWRIRPDRVAMLGFSAGGHVAATAGTHFDAGDAHAADPIEQENSRPDALILCYAVITFAEHRHQGSLENLLGPDAPAALREQLSLERQVTPQTPPTFLWHTADDASVPVENSLLFASALGRRGVPFALHVYPHGRHGLGLATDDPQVSTWTDLCARWLAALDFGVMIGDRANVTAGR